MNKTKISRNQMQAMIVLTTGYAEDDYEFWVSAQRMLYLYVFNIVYVIDVDGVWVARRRSDGEALDNGIDAYVATSH